MNDSKSFHVATPKVPSASKLTPGAYALYALIIILFYFMAFKRILGSRATLNSDNYFPRTLFMSWAPGRARFELERAAQAAVQRDEERHRRERQMTMGEPRIPRIFETVTGNGMGDVVSERKEVREEIEMNELVPRDRDAKQGAEADIGQEQWRRNGTRRY